MKFIKDNDAILFRTICVPFPQLKSKSVSIWKLEMLRPVCIHVIVMLGLPEEHLPLTPEGR